MDRTGNLPDAPLRAFDLDDPAYPPGLRDLRDPPRRLFARGDLPDARAVAIVGARAATPYGLATAHRLAGDLARLGFVVVSGLARGIDAAAHRGAIEAGGRTVAVIPGGLDRVTPAHHAALARSIAVHGAVASEFERGAPWGKGAFVERNRIVAAWAEAVVVVEAAESSGALTTAAAARALGRAVLAVPGDVERPMSRGCLALLRDGARVCAGAGDVLAALSAPQAAPHRWPVRSQSPGATPGSIETPLAIETSEARLAAALRATPLPLEALAHDSGVALAEALATLLHLEWAGIARAHPGQRWSRTGP